ncbi:cysteine-rich receptor-like protein kinase 10 [Durio zibethinus]|uniref:non-specific serine/threonine protein kinase n=1 Tax=Durio zibethinus TaxID=66656 RepID=A0A6P5WWR2_DURZI|nr:cysteine-rich receptor-like protein kinase 10 [Durio zibethinus]
MMHYYVVLSVSGAFCLLLFLSSPLLVISQNKSEMQHSYLYTRCSERFNSSLRFENNLYHLLIQRLYGQGSIYGFFNDTVGENQDKVYGLFLCRGDVQPNFCESCIDLATAKIVEDCAGDKEAIIYYDACLVRFSNRSFFSIMELSPSFGMYNRANATDIDKFETNLLETFANLITKISNVSNYMYATTEVSVSNSTKLYGLAQCTPDLSVADCQSCLRSSIAKILSLATGRKGARVFLPSCSIRYEIYPFYGKPRDESTNTTIIKSPGVESEAPLPSSGVRSMEFPSIQLDILQTATKQFCDENKVGEGGFGPVYKGKLADGKEIAVKRLSRTSGQGLLEFKNEVMLIARLQHRNLVRLLGCCLEQNEKLLVYEYMPNKSLDVFLFDSSIGVQLDWQKRLSIINGIARGILYLHEDSRLRIIHRDLKASNVLLDHEMNPKISDFGMARIFCGNQNEANTDRVVGTYGYMAPEYAMEGLFSVKSDVFSFGVLLLEIISGKRNNGFHLSERGESLLTFAWKLWSKGQGMELIDPLLVQSCVPTQVLKCIRIGLLCLQEDPADRPTMSSVIVMLANETITLPLPAEPAFSVGRVVAEPTQSTSSDRICSVNEVTISNMSPR